MAKKRRAPKKARGTESAAEESKEMKAMMKKNMRGKKPMM